MRIRGKQAESLAGEIAASGFRPDAIVAIARGGLPLAGALGYALDVKMLGSLNVEFYTGVESRLDEPVVLPPTLDRESLVGKRILFAWNDYLFAAIIGSGGAKTLPAATRELVQPQNIQWGQIMAAGTVTTLPMMFLGLVIRKYLVTGLTMGAVKE